MLISEGVGGFVVHPALAKVSIAPLWNKALHTDASGGRVEWVSLSSLFALPHIMVEVESRSKVLEGLLKPRLITLVGI